MIFTNASWKSREEAELFSMIAVVTPSLGWCQPKAKSTETSRPRWHETTFICSSNFPCISHSLDFSSVKWVHSTPLQTSQDCFWYYILGKTMWQEDKGLKYFDTFCSAESNTKTCLHACENFENISEIWVCLRCTNPYSEPFYLANPKDILVFMLSILFRFEIPNDYTI